MPYPPSPTSASPDSLRRIRLYAMAAVIVEQTARLNDQRKGTVEPSLEERALPEAPLTRPMPSAERSGRPRLTRLSRTSVSAL